MKQTEMSKYLKLITAGTGILFLALVAWFLPSVLRQVLDGQAGKGVYWGTCIFIWITAIPCFLCLVKFWVVCSRIGENKSFCRENAEALKQMSHYTLADSVLYALFLAVFCVLGWYSLGIGYLFGIVLILFICITLTVLCAALSHLVYNASQIQEDQDLTI